MIKRVIWLALAVAGCASSGSSERAQRQFDAMTAAQHRQAAEAENREADRLYARAREKFRPPALDFEVPPSGPSFWFFERTWDPWYPEYYTLDPRWHVPGERDAERAAKLRERAEAHLRAADALEGRRLTGMPPPVR